MSYTYEFERPALTVDMAVFMRGEARNFVLLIKRGHEPHKGEWALPGGFVNKGESAEEAASRELYEETNIDVSFTRIDQVGSYTTPDRDSRGWTVSISYATEVDPSWRGEICAGDDAVEAKWFDIEELPMLAFDHDEQLVGAIRKALL